MNQNLNYKLTLQDLFSKRMDGAIAKTSLLDKSIKRVGIGIGAYLTGASLLSFGKSVLESLKNYEYFSTGLRTLLKGDAKAASALEKELITLATKTPFELTEIQDATKQLIGYGFSAGDVTKNIKVLGDVAAGLKIPFQDIAYLYGTLKTQGRAYTRDIMQFTSRGIPVIKELAKQFNVTESSVMKLVETGKVGFKDIEKAFISMTSEGGQFFNMMDEQSKTVGGRISNLSDQWDQFKVKLGQSTSGMIASVTSWAESFVSSLNRGMDAMNMLDKSFEHSAELQFNIWEKYFVALFSKIGMLFGMKPVEGGYAEMQQYASSMQKNYGEKGTTIEEINKNQQSLKNIQANILADKEMDILEKMRRVKILGQVIESNKNRIALFGKKEGAGGSSGSGITEVGGSKIDSGTSMSGSRPQNLYINITKLVETMNIKTENMKEGVQQIKQMVAEVLLETVNDVNYISK